MDAQEKIPEDTILDLDPPFPITTEMQRKAIVLMKALYLAFPMLKQAREEYGWTATELINSADTLRRRGYLKIVHNLDGSLELQITPSGSAEAFLQGVR